MRYIVNPDIFARYPGFMRAVILAEGIVDNGENPKLLNLLRDCEKQVRLQLGDDFKENPRLASWAEVFRSMGINPNKYPPSVLNLVKRVRSGKEMPYVNTLVAAFNCISLRYLCPCGGDDLSAVTGDLLLTFADGSENYVPLGQPDVIEYPPADEVIYMDTGTKDVFCRAWCWKNGDRSKLSPSTRIAAVNIDIMPPLVHEDAANIAIELSEMLKLYTGANIEIRYLTPQTPEFSFPDQTG